METESNIYKILIKQYFPNKTLINFEKNNQRLVTKN